MLFCCGRKGDCKQQSACRVDSLSFNCSELVRCALRNILDPCLFPRVLVAKQISCFYAEAMKRLIFRTGSGEASPTIWSCYASFKSLS